MASSLNREAKAAAKAAENAAKAQKKAIDKLATDKEKAALKSAKAAEKAYERDTKAHQREVEKRIKHAKKEYEQAQKQNKQGLSKGLSLFSSGAGGLAAAAGPIGLAVAGAAIAVNIASAIKDGLFSAASAAADVISQATRESFADDDKARRLAINTGRRDAGDYLRMTGNDVAASHAGITTDMALGGMTAYTSKTGNLNVALAAINGLATVAQASGANLEELSSAAGDLSNNFGIVDPQEMNQAMSTFVAQGRVGQFELPDLARNLGRASAAFAAFNPAEFKGVAGAQKAGGWLNMARQATGSGEAATTAVESMMSSLAAHGKARTVAGVKLYDKGGKMRELDDIVLDAIKSKGKNFEGKKEGLIKLFGEQGIRAINPAIAAYESTYNNARAGGSSEKDALAKAEAAASAKLNEFSKVTCDWNEIIADAAAEQSSVSNQLTQAWEKLKATVGDTLLDSIKQNATEILKIGTGLIPKLVPAFDALALGLDIATDALAALEPVIVALWRIIDKATGGDGSAPDRYMAEREEKMQRQQKVTDATSDLDYANKTGDPKLTAAAKERLAAAKQLNAAKTEQARIKKQHEQENKKAELYQKAGKLDIDIVTRPVRQLQEQGAADAAVKKAEQASGHANTTYYNEMWRNKDDSTAAANAIIAANLQALAKALPAVVKALPGLGDAASKAANDLGGLGAKIPIIGKLLF